MISQFHLLGDDNHGEVTTPVYLAFDALDARGRDLRARQLRDRRAGLDPSLRLDGDGHGTPREDADRWRSTVWLEPQVVVSYSELLQGRLRDPVVRALRQ